MLDNFEGGNDLMTLGFEILMGVNYYLHEKP
jgi:hypothetical protein